MAKTKLVGSSHAIRSPEFHKKRVRQRKVRNIALALLALIIVVAPLVFLRNQHLLIAKVTVSGNEVTKAEDVQAIAMRDLAGAYGWIIPRASTLFYPKSKLVADVLASSPRLSEVKVERTSADTINVTVTERGPKALFCNDVSNIESPTKCYFVDDGGLIYDPAPEFSSGVYLVYTSDSDNSAPVGTNLLPTETFTKLGNFVANFSLIHLTPKVVVIAQDDYRVILAGGTVVEWRQDADLKTVESNLVSFLNDPSIFKNGESIANLAYLDLRIGNKVFYKFKNE